MRAHRLGIAQDRETRRLAGQAGKAFNRKPDRHSNIGSRAKRVPRNYIEYLRASIFSRENC